MRSKISGKVRKIVSVLLAICLVISFMPVNLVNAETSTVYHETFASGVGKATPSGGASLTVVDKVFAGNDDGKALYVSNRANDYDAADIKFTDVGMENGKTYSITVKGYVDADAAVEAGSQAWLQTVGSYGWLGGADLTTGAAFSLTGTYTVDESKDDRIRIQSNAAGKTVPFYIGDLLITTEQSGGTADNVIYHETFESGTGYATQSGGASLAAVDGKVFEGNADGKALYVGNRANNWDAADFTFNDLKLENGKTYTITVKGYIDADVVLPAGAQAALQTISSYGWLSGADLTAGAAFTLTGTYTVDTSTDDRIRIQSNDAGATVPFYIGDVLITGEKASDPVTEKEVYHETFTAGTGIATQSGSASLTQVSGITFDGNDDGAALYVSNRANNWDAADFSYTDLKLENGKTYNITVKGYIAPDAVVPTGAQVALQTISSYGWLSGVDMTTGAAFTLSGACTVDTSTDDRIRIQSNDAGATVPFYIGDVLITQQIVDDGQRPPAIPFTTITFEDQTAGGFTGRAGTETLTVTNEDNHTADGAYALKVEGRTSTWHGPSLHVEKYIDQGSEYKVTAWVKLIDPATSQLQLSTQVGDGSSASYISLASKTINSADGWVMYEGTYRYNNASSEYLTLYVESSNNATASFYIDDISFEKTGSGPIEIQDLTPIKDVYQNDFLIGNAISAEDLEGVRLELLKKHHHIVTAGNAMKPDAMQPTKGNFNFADADKMVDKVLAEGLKMHGHTLAWHSQSPAWLNTTTDANGSTVPLGRDEALENLRTHVKTVMEHFGNKVISWDVVNEAMNDNPPTPDDWKASLRQTPWYHAIGQDYVEQAFLAAREVLDAHPDWDIKLYYNDYNDDNQSKSKAIYNMVKEINDRYAQTHPGKLLIDGVGMQAHYQLSTNPANVNLSLERFISLGVEVSVTELDIQAGSNYQLSDKLAEAQGYLYAQLFKIYKDHAANIARVTFWGMDDGTSWRASSNPLLFDKNLQAKPAYYAVIDPDKFMSEHIPTTPADAKNSTAKYGTPVIDGTIDDIWSKTAEMPVNQYQMAWNGATATAKALWDDKNLYVLLQVSDAQLDKASANAYEQDSVEVFVDENNAKTSFYQEDDGQYRVNFDNETSFNPAAVATDFASASVVSGTNYIVEMKIPFKTVTPEDDKVIGFDAQVNDAKAGARQSVATWNDITGNGYQDTSVYGVLTLTGKEPIIKIPVTVNSDGGALVNVDDSVIDEIIRLLGELRNRGAQPAVTLKLISESPFNSAAVTLPSDAFEKILDENKDASLRILSDLCSLTLNGEAMKSVSKAGRGTTEIIMSKIDISDLLKKSPEAAGEIGNRPSFEFSILRDGMRISNLKQGELAISLPYTLNNSEDPSAVLLYRIDNKNEFNLVISKYQNGAIEFKTDCLAKFSIGYNLVSFENVLSTDYYFAPVTYLGAREVITGNKFTPEKVITRGEALVMLMKAYGIEPLLNYNSCVAVDSKGVVLSSKGIISDRSELIAYYTQANIMGLTKGAINNIQSADLPLTPDALYTLTGNMLDKLGELPETDTNTKELMGFKDYKKTADASKQLITNLVEAYMQEGNFSNEILKGKYVTKAEFATVLYCIMTK